MNILVTGANGFIGRNLVQFLFDQHIGVTALVRKPLHTMPWIPCALVPALTQNEMEQVLKSQPFDAIVHLAAAGVHPDDRDGATLIEMNSLLPGDIVSVASRYGVKAVVIAGSSAEYRGQNEARPLTESAPLESSRLYGASKAAGGLLALAQGVACNVEVAVLRLFNVFGPGEAAHRLLPTLLASLSERRAVELSSGTQVRDFVYVEDVCTGIVASVNALLEHRMPSGAYNLSTGTGCSVIEFGRLANRLWGEDETLLHWGQRSMRPDDLPHVVGDASLLRHYSGWSPCFTLEQGIVAAIDNFRNVKKHE